MQVTENVNAVSLPIVTGDIGNSKSEQNGMDFAGFLAASAKGKATDNNAFAVKGTVSDGNKAQRRAGKAVSGTDANTNPVKSTGRTVDGDTAKTADNSTIAESNITKATEISTEKVVDNNAVEVVDDECVTDAVLADGSDVVENGFLAENNPVVSENVTDILDTVVVTEKPEMTEVPEEDVITHKGGMELSQYETDPETNQKMHVNDVSGFEKKTDTLEMAGVVTRERVIPQMSKMSESTPDEKLDTVLEMVGNVVWLLMDQFGMSFQELKQELSDMGMDIADVTVADGVKQFFLDVQSLEISDLLTNESAGQEFQEFMQDWNQIMNETELPPEEVVQVMESSKDVINTTEYVEENVEQAGIPEVVHNPKESEVRPAKEQPHSNVGDQEPVRDTEYVHSVRQPEEHPNRMAQRREEQTVTVEEQPEVPSKMEITKEERQPEVQVVVSEKESSEKPVVKGTETHTEQRQTKLVSDKPEVRQETKPVTKEVPILQELNDAISRVENMAKVEDVSASDTRAGIVEQIVEQIRVNVNQNTTSMEMQLYPEHLGRIQIHVVSKDGVMTARIVAETETAKQAVESGLSSLKESLQQQNLKVDAVEVMVGMTGFERGQQEQGAQQQAQAGKQSRRFVGAEAEDVPEEEDVELQKMRMSGSSVSYQA